MIILILFSLLKFESLALPYFWDEAWSYIPAISTMAKKLPCLLPGCIDPELYRGHPLFFYFLASAWMKWIASSALSMHILAFLISVLTVISFYRLALLYLAPGWSLLAATLLLFQETFYVQSSFVLPEVVLTLLLIESIRNYVLKRKWRFLFFTGLLCLTKETGVVISAAIILYHVLSTRSVKRDAWWVYLSIWPALVFYTWQKISLGWFFYPLHVDLTNISADTLWSKFGIILKHLFIDQGRRSMLVGAGILIILKSFMDHRDKYLIHLIFLFGSMVLLLIAGNTISILLFLCALITFTWNAFNYTGFEKQFIRLSFVILLLFFGFTLVNFLMIRYLLPSYPVFILLFLIVLHKLFETKPSYSFVLPVFLVINFAFSMIYNYRHKLWHDDASINYTNAVRVHQNAIVYCEQKDWFERRIYTHFLMQQNLTNPDIGYLSEKRFANVAYEGEIQESDEILIFSCIELDEGKYENVKKNPNYQLMERFQSGNAWSEVYSIK